MYRGITPGELRWPKVVEFEAAAIKLRMNAMDVLIGAIWAGYDAFMAAVVEGRDVELKELSAELEGKERAGVDIREATAEVERSISQMLSHHIGRVLDPYAPFHVCHAPREFQSRLPPPAQAPEYDIGFVLNENHRSIWPLEAKVLHTPRALSPYIADLREQFLTGRYAPFSKGGAMVAYLLSGEAYEFLSRLSEEIGEPLQELAVVSSRPHRVSDHQRTVTPGLGMPEYFRCHHLVMLMAQQAPVAAPKGRRAAGSRRRLSA